MSGLDVRSQNWRLSLSDLRVVTKTETPNDPKYEYNYKQLDPIYAQVSSRVVMIGTSSQSAKPWWFLGARVSRFLYVSPSTSGQFIAGVQLDETRRVGLSRLTLLEFKSYDVDSYVLAIEPPYWLEDIYVEVWEYIGIERSLDVILQELTQLLDNAEQLLNGISVRLAEINNSSSDSDYV